MSDNTSIDGANTQHPGTVGSKSQYPHQNPIASLLEPAKLDDLEIFGTIAETGLTSAWSSCDPPKSRGPQAISSGESATNRHRNRHEPDSQSTKSSRQSFCGCGFGTSFSEISNMIHRRLSGCGKQVHGRYANRHQDVAIPNKDEDGAPNNSVDELTPLLTQPRKKQKAARKPNVATKTTKIRVLTQEVVTDNMLTSATKADGLIRDDIQGSSTTPPSRICSVPVDFVASPSNAPRISLKHSYALPVQFSPPITPTEPSLAGSLERFWTKPPLDTRSGQRSNVASKFGPWRESNQVHVFQNQFNDTRPQQQPRADDIQPVDRGDQSRKSGRKPSRFTRTRDRFRASLVALPAFLSTQLMTSISTVAIHPTMVSSRKPPFRA